MSLPSKREDWSAAQYLKFHSERTRAVHELAAQTIPHLTNPNSLIYDLGCGPGNSTEVLHSAFPSATITGLDSSPDMLSKARATLPSVTFEQGDVSTYTPSADADLLFSNAVFHWLRHADRIPTLARLFSALKSGAVLTFQVPDNYHERSHAAMRDTALATSTPGGPAPWHPYFADARVGDRADARRPDLDPIERPEDFYDALAPLAREGGVDVWRTTYHHVLDGPSKIVEWVRGTGLQPFLQRVPEGEVREAFLKEYERRVGELYGKLVDGKVLLAYPRLFVVAVRK